MKNTTRKIDDSPREVIKRVLSGTGLDDDLAAGYADLICREFSGEQVYFALRQWEEDGRDQLIRGHRAAGRSQRWLSQHYGLSRAQVRRICGELRDDQSRTHVCLTLTPVA